ncbi:MAG TPA: hypothetical protein VF456_23990 [Vicinamibacterales bacterium]
MALFASWSPGIAFMPAEIPGDMVQVGNVEWTAILGLRQSGGATFQGRTGTSNWFHVPIATPVIISDKRVKLARVFVMFQCGDASKNNADLAGCNVTRIDVWDGPNRIHRFGPVKLFGEHRFKFDTNNMHAMPAPHPDIFFGIELAVQVSFSMDNFPITFASAGADFDA